MLKNSDFWPLLTLTTIAASWVMCSKFKCVYLQWLQWSGVMTFPWEFWPEKSMRESHVTTATKKGCKMRHNSLNDHCLGGHSGPSCGCKTRTTYTQIVTVVRRAVLWRGLWKLSWFTQLSTVWNEGIRIPMMNIPQSPPPALKFLYSDLLWDLFFRLFLKDKSNLTDLSHFQQS